MLHLRLVQSRFQPEDRAGGDVVLIQQLDPVSGLLFLQPHFEQGRERLAVLLPAVPLLEARVSLQLRHA